MNNRDNTLDLLKGFAIFLVVLGHINVVTPVENLIYSFHMSLFMFISGCTFWYSYKKSEKAVSYIFNRFLSLIIPYIAWSFFYYWFYNNNNFVAVDFIKYPINLSFFDRLWFLPTLFSIIVIATISMSMTKHIEGRRRVFLQVVLCCFGFCILEFFYTITNIKLFRQGIIYILPFYFGLFFMQYPAFKRFCTKPFFLISFILLFVLCFPFYSVDDKSVISLVSRFICGIAIVIPLYKFVNHKNELYYNNVWCEAIATLGKNTIAVYTMQEFFRPLFYNTLPNIFYDTILKVLSAILICVITVFIKIFIETISPVLSFIMFGTKIKRQ